jgi:SAM-dependent methyltransferase
MLESITREYYRTTSGRGHKDEQIYYDKIAKSLRRRIAGWLPANKNLACLDLGCGCGEMLYLLESTGCRDTTGVDLCVEELAKARLFVHGKLVHSDIEEFLLQQPSNSLDYVTALNILEHLPKDKLLTVLSSISRVLRPGGNLIVMVPNALSPFSSTTRHWDITHEWAFAPNNFRQLAPLSGFDSQIDFKECAPVPYGLISTVRFVLWQLIRAGIAFWYLVETGTRKDPVYTMDMLVRLTVRK